MLAFASIVAHVSRHLLVVWTVAARTKRGCSESAPYTAVTAEDY